MCVNSFTNVWCLWFWRLESDREKILWVRWRLLVPHSGQICWHKRFLKKALHLFIGFWGEIHLRRLAWDFISPLWFRICLHTCHFFFLSVQLKEICWIILGKRILIRKCQQIHLKACVLLLILTSVCINAYNIIHIYIYIYNVYICCISLIYIRDT